MGSQYPWEYERHKALEHLLEEGPQAGRELREKINHDLRTATEMRQLLTRLKLGFLLGMNPPNFYHMMARLEDANEVEGWYEQRQIHNTTVPQRWYKISEGGIRVMESEEVFAAAPDFRLGWNPS